VSIKFVYSILDVILIAIIDKIYWEYTEIMIIFWSLLNLKSVLTVLVLWTSKYSKVVKNVVQQKILKLGRQIPFYFLI
jgi:hypothetical protein